MKYALLLSGLLCSCDTSYTDDTSDDKPDGSDSVPFEEDNGTNPRPAAAPDVMIFTVSGHNLSGEFNQEYLLNSGTPGIFANVFIDRGFSVVLYDYVDEFYSWVDHNDAPLVYGFLSLVADLEYVKAEWISNFDNPTRVIIVAHSHGDVWAHIAANLVDIPIDFLIDFDGESTCWENDTICGSFGDRWKKVIDEYRAEYGDPWPFDIAEAADHWSVPGVSQPQDIEELVPDWVSYNIEIHANGYTPPILNDDELNWRLDGSDWNILTFQSNEGHSDVYKPGSDAVNDVTAILEDVYF